MAMSYDIGLLKNAMPDWETLTIDALAKRILDDLPDGFMLTTVRNICAAYHKCEEESDCEPIQFLRADDGAGMTLECWIRDTKDEEGNFANPHIEGHVDLHEAGIEISANSVLLTALPASITARDLEGTPVSDLIEMRALEGRMIESVKTTENNVLLQLSRTAPLSWKDEMERWNDAI